MKTLRYLLIGIGIASMMALTGCKAQQQMQQQLSDLDTKVSEDQRRIATLDAELKKANFEIGQIKGLVTKMGTVVVDLQKAEEERQRAAAEAKAKGGAKSGKKAAPAPVKKKKH